MSVLQNLILIGSVFIDRLARVFYGDDTGFCPFVITELPILFQAGRPPSFLTVATVSQSRWPLEREVLQKMLH